MKKLLHRPVQEFFSGALEHLRIRLSLVARFESADETGKLPPHISAVLNSAVHP